MAWTPLITISRGRQPPRSEDDKPPWHPHLKHAHRPNNSQPHSLDPHQGCASQQTIRLSGAGSVCPCGGTAAAAAASGATAQRPSTKACYRLWCSGSCSRASEQAALGRPVLPSRRCPIGERQSEDTFGVLPSRSLGLPSVKPQLPGCCSTAAIRVCRPAVPLPGAPNSQPEAAMPQYRVQREGQWPWQWCCGSFCSGCTRGYDW